MLLPPCKYSISISRISIRDLKNLQQYAVNGQMYCNHVLPFEGEINTMRSGGFYNSVVNLKNPTHKGMTFLIITLQQKSNPAQNNTDQLI